jgi:hypothetical protein
MENMADLDAARRKPVGVWRLSTIPPHRASRRWPHIWTCPLFDDLGHRILGQINVKGRHRHVEIGAVAEHFRLARVGQDDELVAQIAADGAGVGAHRESLQPQRAKVRR